MQPSVGTACACRQRPRHRLALVRHVVVAAQARGGLVFLHERIGGVELFDGFNVGVLLDAGDGDVEGLRWQLPCIAAQDQRPGQSGHSGIRQTSPQHSGLGDPAAGG